MEESTVIWIHDNNMETVIKDAKDGDNIVSSIDMNNSAYCSEIYKEIYEKI